MEGLLGFQRPGQEAGSFRASALCADPRGRGRVKSCVEGQDDAFLCAECMWGEVGDPFCPEALNRRRGGSRQGLVVTRVMDEGGLRPLVG